MGDLLKKYPAYEGTEPYLYFAFCRADAPKVEPLLALLYERGCRIWYDVGTGGNASGRQHRLERSRGAALAVIYLSENALADGDEVKSAVLYCQSRGLPVICLDVVESSDLSTGFTGDTRHVRPGTAAQTEAALIRTEGFSQALIGQRQRAKSAGSWKKILSAVLAVMLAALSYLYLTGYFTPKDTAVLEDAVISAAAHRAVGVLTQESLDEITQLHLEGVPGDLTDLSRMPNLERVEIPQEAVWLFADAPGRTYTVVVTGGK